MNTDNQVIESDRQERNSSIELLRIISMIMITFHHFAVHGGFVWSANEVTIPHFWYNLISMGGKIGVDVFILISGYFLIDSRGGLFNFKRVIKIWGQVFFYLILFYLLFCGFGLCDFHVKTLIKACFPFAFDFWWFASTYFVLYLLHPFINKMLNSFDKKTYQAFLFLTVFCWSVIPTFVKSQYQGNSLLWFITLYAIAGYAKRFGFNEKIHTKHYFMLFILFSVITYLTSAVFTILGAKNEKFAIYTTCFYGQEKLTILLISLTLFMAFATLRFKYSKLINTIASATFGVYLIHDNCLVRPFLWREVFKNYEYQNSKMIIVYSIGVVVLVYVVCTIIDLIRQLVFEKMYLNIVNKYSHAWFKPL